MYKISLEYHPIFLSRSSIFMNCIGGRSRLASWENQEEAAAT